MQTIMIVEDDPDIRDGVRIALDCNRVWVDEQEADLTETEYKTLKLLMQSPQRIFPVQVIYETVWGEPYFYVSNGTVSASALSGAKATALRRRTFPSASSKRTAKPGLPLKMPSSPASTAPTAPRSASPASRP